MAQRIKILPENLTNKIAAGEVVERPASVVKELVENALDAGCADVVVEIESGGRRLIKVSDDGCGMTREDALLALERHATSKIASDQDLFTLSTLGFRGEALPSIASVSRFTLASRERGNIEGTEVYVEGGRIKEVKACGMAEGTFVEVRNLFFNTPARLKFMKSVDTEAGHVGELLARLAISRPEVRFTYIHDGKTVFRALSGDLRSRAAALLGATLSRDLFPLEFAQGGITVKGLVARPECNRAAASHLYTYINGRFIRDRVVQHAILQSYRNFLERGRYPVVVLFIDLPAGEVDVNVHPTKHEVRFREQAKVHDAIQSALESVLRATPWLHPLRNAAPLLPKVQTAVSPAAERVAEVREALDRYAPPLQSLQPCSSPFHAAPTGREGMAAMKPLAQGEAAGFFSGLAVIGQFNAAYILCEEAGDLIMIDQHAAHERVAFERLKAQFASGAVESQGLLFPEPLELSFSETAVLKENAAAIARLGFELEPFGGATWLLKALPRLIAATGYLRTLRDILEELGSLGNTRTFEDIRDDILTKIACHSVVRGAHPLTRQEISALLALMDVTDFASNCPHGRPVFRKITLGEIERMFKR